MGSETLPSMGSEKSPLLGRKRLHHIYILYVLYIYFLGSRLLHCDAILFHCVASLGRKLLYALQGIYYRFGVFDITTLTFRNIIFRMFQNKFCQNRRILYKSDKCIKIGRRFHIAAIENIGYI